MNYNNNYKNPSVSKSFNNFNKKINLHKTELNSTPQDNLFPSFSYINGGRFLALFLWPTCQECNDYCNCDWFKELIKNNLYLRFCKHPVYGWYNRFIKIECKRDVCSYSIYKIKDSFDVDWFDKRIDYLYNLTQQLTTTGLDNFYELLTKGLTKENWNNFSNNLDNYVKEINKPKLDLISALNSSSNIISDSKNKTIEFDSSKLELIKPEIIIQKTEEIIEEIEVIQLGNGSSKNEPKEQGEDDEFKSKKARVRNLNNHLKPLLDDKKGMVEFFISTTIDEKINKVKRIKDLKNNDLVAKKIANKYIKKAGFIVCMSITEYHESSNPQHHMLGLKPPCSDACSLLDKSDRKRKFCWGCIDEQNEIFGLGKVNVRNVVDRIDTIDYATKRLKTSKDFSKKVIVPKSIKSSYLKENRKLDKLDKNDKKCLGWEKKEKIDNKDINITTPIVEVNKKKDFYHKNYLDNKPERNAKRAYQTRLLSLKKYEEDLNIPADKKQIKIDRLKKYIQEYELANGIK